jgi:hypothetical protein
LSSSFLPSFLLALSLSPPASYLLPAIMQWNVHEIHRNILVSVCENTAICLVEKRS